MMIEHNNCLVVLFNINISTMSKSVKIILVIVGVLAFLLLIVPLFLPSVATVQKSVVVDRPLELIYDDLLDFNIYKQWSPWSEQEPDAEAVITGMPGEIGHKWEWKGEKLGVGSLELKEFETYVSIYNELIFVEPRQAVAKDLWQLERTDEGFTKITWIYEGEAKYPFGRYAGLMMESFLGKDYEKGLENLKTYFESNY